MVIIPYDEFQRNFYLKPLIQLSGYVMNKKNDQLMSIEITYEDENQKIGTFTSDINGYYHILLPEKRREDRHARVCITTAYDETRGSL